MSAAPRVSVVLPTRNRPERLAETIDALGALPISSAEAEVIVVDNASRTPPIVPPMLPNGVEARVLHRRRNEGAAARNLGVEAARGSWILMLDDDSHPIDTGFLETIDDAPEDVGAIGAEIYLAAGAREAGGLPEVFIGCGVLIRRGAFLRAGGYDPSFHYYVEEYDLSAKLLLDGWRIVHDRRFRVRHQKSQQGRDMNEIFRLLVRNNCWVAARYAPASERRAEIRRHLRRYQRIAELERASWGYLCGMLEVRLGLWRQPRRPMDQPLWDRFTGLAAARAGVRAGLERAGARRVAIVEAGKNDWAVRRAIEECGATLVSEDKADALVIGALSPGPILDAWERIAAMGRRVIAPWWLIERNAERAEPM